MPRIPLGKFFEIIIQWLKDNWQGVFSAIRIALQSVIDVAEYLLLLPPAWAIVLVVAPLCWKVAGRGVAIFSALGLLLIDSMEMWDATMQTLALVLVSTVAAFLVGLPLGIWAARNAIVEQVLRPVLDFMQTMPAFVYLIPAVLFFTLGEVPGAMATMIFSLPPSARLTTLGIQQVPIEVVEAARAFGATERQLLFKVQIPIALPTILAGVNQTIMLALSMVVIAAMIGAGGLGEQVLKGITQLRIGLGFESGLSVVILAMILDRLTQSLKNLVRAGS